MERESFESIERADLEEIRRSAEYIQEDIYAKFITDIQREMEEQGINQSDLAEEFEVSSGAVSQYFNLDNNNISLKTIAKISEVLDLRWDISAIKRNG